MGSVIGNRYGRLVVIAEEPHGMLLCRCDCGKLHRVGRNNLIYSQSGTKSCGCYRREVVSEIGKTAGVHNIEKARELNMRYGTNVYRILKGSTSKANKTGYTGVHFNSRRHDYEAYISFRKHRYHLGHFKTLPEAVSARRAAEEKFYQPIIEEQAGRLDKR